MIGARDVLRQAFGIVYLRYPLCHLAVHSAVIDLLERFAIHHVPANLPDEQNHRGRVLVGDMNSGSGIGGSGAARDHTHPRLAGELAVGFRHHGGAPFLTTHHGADGGRVVKPVEQGEKALSWYAKRRLASLYDELIGDDLSAVAQRAHDAILLERCQPASRTGSLSAVPS